MNALDKARATGGRWGAGLSDAQIGSGFGGQKVKKKLLKQQGKIAKKNLKTEILNRRKLGLIDGVDDPTSQITKDREISKVAKVGDDKTGAVGKSKIAEW